MKMSDIDDFVAKVNDVKIPAALDRTIRQAIHKGGSQMKRKRRIGNIMKSAAVFAVVLTTLAVSINVVPAFAAQIEQLPGGEAIVKLLTLNRQSVGGGEITDGYDIGDIEKEPGKTGTPATDENPEKSTQPEEQLQSEVIKISIGNGEAEAPLNHYEVTYLEYPYSAVVYLSGVRSFSAADELKKISEGPLVKNAYRLITLDDSAHRFVINFKKPVNIEVTEETNPAKLVLTIKEEQTADDPAMVYSVRSESLPFGEQVAAMEEILTWQYNSEHARQMQDADGTYLTEEGYYTTEAEAQARIDELNALDTSLILFIEERMPEQLPKVMK